MEGLFFVRGMDYCKMSGEYEVVYILIQTPSKTCLGKINHKPVLVRFLRSSNDNTAKGFRARIVHVCLIYFNLS